MTTRRGSEARGAAHDSFEELYRGHRAEVFRAALRELGNVHDAEDVTQSAFVDAYRAVLRGSEPHAPRAWLLAIGENVRRRRFRAAQRRPREEPIDEDLTLAEDASHELAAALAEALAELPPEQRQAFVLRELAGLSYEEIAAETQSTVGAIQMLLFRARKSLRERLEPPQVHRRRGGAVLPLPGWLAGLVSRADVAVVTPRAVGAVGASVAAVVASLAVDNVQAEPPASVAVEKPSAGATAAPVATGFVSQRAARRSRPTPTRAAATPAAVPATMKPRRANAAPTATPAAAPVEEAAAPAQATALTASPAAGVSTPEAPRVRVEVPEEIVDVAAEPSLPSPPPVPPLPTEPVEEAAAGAAGAAGVGDPPLPVPVVPPVTLPPAP